jgi:chromosome segregation ATPase
MHPGLARARELDAQAQDLANQIQGCEDQLADLRQRIANLDSRSSSYRWEASSLNQQVSDVQRQESALSSRRYAIVQQANDQRAITADYNAPAVVAAKAKVADLTNQLEQAQTTLREQTAPYRDRLDDATQAYNHQMAASRAVVGDAQRRVDQAQAAATEAQNRLAHLGKEVGWWRKFWWKLSDHFDAGKFMDEQVKLANG